MKASTADAGGFGEAVLGTGDSIYVIRGHSAGVCQFWKYNPGANSWATVLEWSPDDPLPRPKGGTSLAWDQGNYAYTLLGAAYADSDRRYFYRYSIAVNSWERLSDTPHAQGPGTALAWSRYDGSFYAFIGSRVHGTVFARYLPVNNTWEMLPFNPTWTVTDDGASLVWTGGEYLYALRGEWEETTPHNDFARYHIPTRTWETKAVIPVGNGVGDGASLLWVGEYPNYIFALGGNDVVENPGYGFYRYSISSDSWTSLEQIPYPVGYYVGNRLGFASGNIYYWQGASTTWSGGGNQFCMFSVTERWIAFISSSDASAELYAIKWDGTILRRLTYNSVSESSPSISEDGQWIAFINGVGLSAELYVLKADGTSLKRLTHNSIPESCPSISGDGHFVAFVSGSDTSAELYVISRDGSSLKRLTYNSIPESGPSLSGDGKWITFIVGSGLSAELYVIKPDGTGLKRLTYNPVPESSPSISYDGYWIAFICGSDSSSELYIISRDAATLRRLTYNSVADSIPSISHDGQWIVFANNVDSSTELYVIKADRTSLKRLTYNSVAESGPSVSGDGQFVAFICGSDASAELYVIGREGTPLKRLTYNSVRESSPSMS